MKLWQSNNCTMYFGSTEIWFQKYTSKLNNEYIFELQVLSILHTLHYTIYNAAYRINSTYLHLKSET